MELAAPTSFRHKPDNDQGNNEAEAQRESVLELLGRSRAIKFAVGLVVMIFVIAAIFLCE